MMLAFAICILFWAFVMHVLLPTWAPLWMFLEVACLLVIARLGWLMLTRESKPKRPPAGIQCSHCPAEAFGYFRHHPLCAVCYTEALGITEAAGIPERGNVSIETRRRPA